MHNNIAKNKRQPYCVSEPAGHQVGADQYSSFVAEIPLVEF